MYNPHPKRKLLADMDKTQLLRMRDEGMSNEEIALRVGCSYQTIYRAIGKQPDHISARRKSEGYVMIAGTARTSEGGVYRGTQGAQLYLFVG